MTKTAWTRDGKILVDSHGRVIICDHCPCDDGGSSSSSSSGITIPLVPCGDMTVPKTLYIRPQGVEAINWFDLLPCSPCVNLIEGDNTFSVVKDAAGPAQVSATCRVAATVRRPPTRPADGRLPSRCCRSSSAVRTQQRRRGEAIF
jgi:hypothetical protein